MLVCSCVAREAEEKEGVIVVMYINSLGESVYLSLFIVSHLFCLCQIGTISMWKKVQYITEAGNL